MKKLITILAVLALLVSTIALVTVSAATEETVYSGTCGADGDNLTWTLDTATGELVISGEGDMKNYSLTNGATNAPWYSYRTSIKTVAISNGVTSIGDSAFSGCSGLTSVTIPNSVTSIGKFAFYKCSGLTGVYITDIAAWCNISFSGDMEYTDFTSNPLCYAKNLYLNGELIKDLVIPDGVTSISDYAFYNCSGLTSVTIPNSVTSIGEGAFRGCSGFTSVYITALAAWCNIKFDNSISNPLYYANNLYLNGKLITELVVPDSVTNIGNFAFYNCTSLTSVTIPNSVTSIGYGAFEECTGLTSINIPNSVTSIGGYAFSDCTGLTSVTIPNSVTSIEWGAFYNCSGLTSVTIPNRVTSIGGFAFIGCSGLTSVTIGNSSININASSFDGCLNIKDVNFCGTDAQWAVIASNFPSGVSVNYHTWDNGTETTPPMHTTEGVKTFTCSICGDSKTESIDKLPEHEYGSWGKHNAEQHIRFCPCGDIAYADHAWNNGVITTAPTHLADGQKTYTCTDCGETKFETVAKTTEHTYGEWGQHNADKHAKVCACGDVIYADHAWNNGVITTAPTHLADGQKTYTCSDCGETKFETVAKTTEHTYGEWGKHNADKHAKVCACGDVVYANHAWNQLVSLPASHTEYGVAYYACTDCGEIKIEVADLLADHTYGEWGQHNADKHAKVCACGDVVYADHAWDNSVITTAPTHLADGQKTYTCTDCGEIKIETVAKTTEHTYGEWISVDGNEHKHICSCGNEVKEAHAWNEGEIISAPTAKDEGTKLYRCEACDELKLEAIPVIEEEGCGSYLGGGVSVILLVSGLSAVTLRKKKRK